MHCAWVDCLHIIKSTLLNFGPCGSVLTKFQLKIYQFYIFEFEWDMF